jgi:hypothetical protein
MVLAIVNHRNCNFSRRRTVSFYNGIRFTVYIK